LEFLADPLPLGHCQQTFFASNPGGIQESLGFKLSTTLKDGFAHGLRPQPLI
jgi:hypothetical protein